MGKSKTNIGKVSVSRIVMNIIHKYAGVKGISLSDLKNILRQRRKFDTDLHDSEVKLALKNAMDRKILSLEDGLYKVFYF